MAGVSHNSAGPAGPGLSAAQATLRAAFANVVPGPVARALARDPRDVRIDANGEGGFVLQTPAGIRRLGPDLEAELRSVTGAMAALTITVPASAAFVRRLNVPAAASTRLDDVLDLDLERSTPFRRDTVFSAHRIVARDRTAVSVEHVLIKSLAVQPILAAAAAAGLPVKSIRIDGDGLEDLNLLPIAQRQRSAITRGVRTATSLAAGALACLIIGTYAWQTWQLIDATAAATSEQTRLTAEVAAMRREADAADRTLQDAHFARARRIANPMAVAVLEDLTQRLPDTTWLTEVRLDETTMVLEGHSTNAAELVSLLSRSPFVATAAFAAPITRDPVRGTERFQIRMARKTGPAAP